MVIPWLSALMAQRQTRLVLKKKISSARTSEELELLYESVSKEPVAEFFLRLIKNRAQYLANELYVSVIYLIEPGQKGIDQALLELNEAKRLAKLALRCKTSWESRQLYKEILTKQKHLKLGTIGRGL